MVASNYLLQLRARAGDSLLLLPAVAAVILNKHNELLLQQKPSEGWSLPAGMIEPGETPRQAIVREVGEETVLVVEPVRVIDVFGGEAFRYVYPNGDSVEYTIVLMQCAVVADTGIITDSETLATAYFSQANMPELALPYPLSALFGAG